VLQLPGGIGSTGGLEHPVPQPAGGAKLRDRQELLVAGGVAELDERRRGRHVQPHVLGEHAEVRRTDRQAVAELLGVGSALVVDRRGIDGESEQPVPTGELGEPDHHLRGPGAGAAVPPQPGRDRVAAQAGAGCRGDSALLENRDQRLGCGDRVRGSVEDDRGEVEVHLLEHARQVRHSDPAATDRQPQAGRAAFQVLDRRLRGEARVRVGDMGADVPALVRARQLGATNVRRLAGPPPLRESDDGPDGAQRRNRDAVERGARELLPHQRVGVLGGHPPGLPEDVGRGLLPLSS
jgi:hypothetical protein